MKKSKRAALAVFGLFVICGAIIFVLDHMGILDFEMNYALCIFAVLFVYGLLGTIGVTGHSDRVPSFASFGFALFCAAMCVKYQPWFPEASAAVANISPWYLMLACVAVVIGLSIIRKAITGKSGFVEIHKEVNVDRDGNAELSDGKSATNVFNSRVISFAGEVFDGYELDSVFGEVTLDLTGAIVEHDCVLKVSSVFGSVKIITGGSANFSLVNGDSVFGSAKSYRNGSDEALPTVSVHADAVFGSVEIV